MIGNKYDLTQSKYNNESILFGKWSSVVSSQGCVTLMQNMDNTHPHLRL